MTTIAFDGVNLASDTLAVDAWGFKHIKVPKIFKAGNQDFGVGAAGGVASIAAWRHEILGKSLCEVIEHGYPAYEEGKDCPSIMICASNSRIWTLIGRAFFEVNRKFHAVGSGRDFAIAAMHLGKSAAEAVAVAAEFDNNTGNTLAIIRV